MKKAINRVSSLIFITFNKNSRASGRLYIKYATDMDVLFDLSDSVKVTIRQKDRSCYVELSSETNRHFISSDVWLKTDWASEVEHSLCIGYRKFAVRKANGQILFLSRRSLQLCFIMTTTEWYILQDFYATISQAWRRLDSVSSRDHD